MSTVQPSDQDAVPGVKKFVCGTRDICAFKNHYVNNRCFASYPARQCCPHIVRADGKTMLEGSKQERLKTQ